MTESNYGICSFADFGNPAKTLEGEKGKRWRVHHRERGIMRVVGYLRVSTDGQIGEDKFGLESQRESIEDFCGKKGYEIAEWYTDQGISGASEDRPEFNRILQGDIPEGVEAVVVAKSDRVARDVYIYFAFKNELRKKGLQIISVAEDFRDKRRGNGGIPLLLKLA